MAWSFVGVSSVVEVSTTAHALVTTGITGLQAGDLMIACISSRIASTTSVTLPAGWTLVAEQKNNNIATNNSAAASGLMAYHVRGASNPALTFTHPVAPAPAIGRIVAYRGVNAVTPKDTQVAAQTATNTTAVSVAGLTTTALDDLIVAMAAGGQEAAWSAFNATSPSGASGATVTTAPTTTWSERADSLTTTGNDTSLAIFDAIKNPIGATGNFTATASVAAVQVIIAGAFKGPTATVLPAAEGEIVVTGTAAGFLRTRVMPAAAVAITLTGNAAGMGRGFKGPSATGSVTLTGSLAGLRAARRLSAATSAIVASGVDATLTYTPDEDEILSAAPGAIAITAAAAGLRRTRGMAGAQGSVAVTGLDATLKLRLFRKLLAEPGGIVLTGYSATLSAGIRQHYRLEAAPDTVVVFGAMVNLQIGNRQPGPLHFGRPLIRLPYWW